MSARCQRRSAIWLVLAMAGSAGCDGVGSALVDHRFVPPDDGVLVVPCNVPPPCDDPLDEVSAEPAAVVRPLPLTNCGPTAAELCGLTAPDVEPDEQDAGIDPDTDCAHAADRDGTPLRDDTTLSCAALTVRGDASEGEMLRVRGLELENVNLSVVSTAPFVFELEQAVLEDVFVQLEGPVTLRVRASTFAGVQVATAPSPAVPASLELEQIDGSNIRIGGEGQRFRGTVAVTRSSFVDVQLVVDDLVLESVSIVRRMVDAQTLTAADSQFSDALLDFDRGLLSASRVARTPVRSCGSLTLIDSQVLRSSIAPCDGVLRAYSSRMIGVLADGEIESDRSRWESTRFGTRSPTQMVVWGGGVMSANFCSLANSVRIGGGATIRCDACETGLEAADAVCVEPEFASNLSDNACAAFASAPACTDTVVRARPLEHPF